MALDYIWEGRTLAGWLSGFRAHTGYVACDVIRCLGEAAARGGGGWNCGLCPDFVLNTLTFALQLRKIRENLSHVTRMAIGILAPNAIRLSTWPLRAVATTVLLSSAALSFHVTHQSQPTVSLSTCRVAVLGGSPHQLTLSQISYSGL